MFNLIYLSYNKAMSMDNSGQTLEQLKKHIPDLINVQPFNESLASCLANIFQIFYRQIMITYPQVKFQRLHLIIQHYLFFQMLVL